MTTLWQFRTKRFTVKLLAEYDRDPDLSWRDEDQERYDEERGVEYWQFDVVVYLDGIRIASDSLGGSGYSDPQDFAREHRDPNPMNRNCSIRRKREPNTVILHYFPSMVASAIDEARRVLADRPRLRA